MTSKTRAVPFKRSFQWNKHHTLPGRCLASPKARNAGPAQGLFFFHFSARVAWLIPIVRVSMRTAHFDKKLINPVCRVARAQGMTRLRSSLNHSGRTERAPLSSQGCLVNKKPAGVLASRLLSSYWQDGLDSSPTARIERAPFYRARSASTGDEPGCLAIPRRNGKACWLSPAGFFVTRQRPTFPLPHSSSIIGLGGLNFRVRDGNGCGPSGKATGNILRVLSSEF